MNRETLEDAIFDAYPELDMSDIEDMSLEELERLLMLKQKPKAEPKPQEPIKPRRDALIVERITPDTITEAFAVKNGRLMRRMIYRRTIAGMSGESVRLFSVGERVRFAGTVYRSAHVLHFLLTGEWVTRKAREKVKRYRGRVRVGEKLIHLGYFSTEQERDAAVLMYRLSQPITNPEGD